MKIETKFYLGDEVWFINENRKAEKAKVDKMNIHLYRDQGNYGKEARTETYTLDVYEWGTSSTTQKLVSRDSKDLFATKEILLASL